MELTFSYILSQILTVVEYGLLGASYLAKNRKAVVFLDILSMSTGIIVYILLGADLGMAMSVIILLANFYYLWDENHHNTKERSKLHPRDYIVLAVVLLAIGIVTIFTYDGPLSLLSVAATALYEISIWQKSTKVYKFCWMSYNGFEQSIFGVLCEAVMFIASIIGYVRELKAEKSKKHKLSAKAKPKSKLKNA